jgi:hypothetical protein
MICPYAKIDELEEKCRQYWSYLESKGLTGDFEQWEEDNDGNF